MTRVAILGGGVAGLSAAHELAERGFEVVVLEARDIPGGKARSLPVPGSGTGGRADLPAEHGFRFFPGSTATCRTRCGASGSATRPPSTASPAPRASCLRRRAAA